VPISSTILALPNHQVGIGKPNMSLLQEARVQKKPPHQDLVLGPVSYSTVAIKLTMPGK